MLEKLAEFGVLPVIAVDTVDQGLNLCEALMKGGLAAAEITFRTDAAEATIKAVVKEFPTMTVGAGTVLTVKDLNRAMDAGASFAVAPGCNPTVVKAAVDADFDFAPGICTPSDIERALEFGVSDLKFFPAEAAGGVPMLTSICAPYMHLGLQVCPTGGIKLGNMASYLSLPYVPVVGGTWLAPKDKIKAGDWDAISALAAEAVQAVKAL
ncbi:MAG: bifunctional 4-hydroxy-2-oxoglutarate aldolase/2-dehydro-3-deoxy-phosphogluconate aldolase [Lentisphaeria bacterium]|nr:bifunctional 4-hydroxy-2-oxoglutarate aldolase/2-dehydro-3-deoxy-phosphogluconate aldolase [Lentisphaeria bacterium]